MDDLKRYEIYLGALLHDIGKFYQRSDTYYKESSKISNDAKGIADYICPADQKGKMGYLHVIWTADFLKKISGILKEMKLEEGLFSEKNNSEDNLINLAIYHHKPNTNLQRLIQLADWWSSGLDRNKSYQKMDSNNFTDFRNVRLQSIFNLIQTGNNNFDGNDYEIQLKEIKLAEEAIFPVRKEDNIDNYGDLWDSFANEAEHIPIDKGIEGVEAFCETMLFLLKKYTSVVPASTMRGEIPETTLYDHMKSTAAIAQSLYDFFVEKAPGKIEDKDFIIKDYFDFEKNNNITAPLLLFCGDINGIQKFIYNIASKKAAMSLKGRSFYVQLLTDTLIQRLIDDCNVSMANIIYSSGGKFFVLLPNTEFVKSKIDSLIREVEEKVFEKHDGELYVCFDYVEFGYNNKVKVFYNDSIGYDSNKNYEIADNLGPVWKLLFDKINASKKKKFRHLIVEKYDKLFKPAQVKYNTKICAVRGVEIDEKEAKNLKTIGSKEDVWVSPIVYEQSRIGQLLKTADFFITFREIGDKSYKAWTEKSIQPLDLKVHHYLFSQKELTGDQSEFRFISSADVARVKRFNNTDFSKINKLKGKKSSYGFSFYGGNTQAFKKASDELKNFEELAGEGEGGFRRLGVLRMDVDNLGRIFIEGVPEERKNLSVYSTLSNQLDLFFSGYINTIRNSEQFMDNVNILYSGGDDIFAIGKWDIILDFAEKVRDDFRRYVCNRDDISISAGIALVSVKFPISKAAQLAADAESKAKSFRMEKENGEVLEKNSINIFGENIQWGKEFQFTKHLAKELFEWIKDNKISKSLLQRFFIFRKIKNMNRQDWRWLSAYTFAQSQRHNSKGKQELEKLKILMITGKCEFLSEKAGQAEYYHFETSRALDLLCIAARWADFKIRE